MPKIPGWGELRIEARAKESAKFDPDAFLSFEHQRLADQTVSGKGKLDFNVQDSTFERCTFEDFKPRFAPCLASGKERSYYFDCTFQRCTFRHLNPGLARFERCHFQNVHITNLFSHAAEFVDCSFSGTLEGAAIFGRVAGIHVDYTTRVHNEIRGNDFSQLKMLDCDFRRGVDLRLQKLPAGDDYLYLRAAEQKLSAMRRKYLQQPLSQRRTDVFAFLEFWEENVRDGQAELFICKGSSSFEHAIEKEIWRELDSF